MDETSSSNKLNVISSSTKENELSQVLTLVSLFLETCTDLSETAALLRSEVEKKKILPSSIGWNGEVVSGKLPDVRSLRALPGNHLVKALRLSSSSTSSSSALPAFVPFSKQQQAFNLIESSFKAICESEKFGISQLKNKPSIELIDLRLKLRQLIRELNSNIGRSSSLLNEKIEDTKVAIENLSKYLSSIPRVRRESNRNIIDRINSPEGCDNLYLEHSVRKLIISRIKMLKKITAHRAEIFCASSLHSQWIFTAADDGIVKTWNASTGHLHACYRGHKNVVTDIACTNDLIVSGSEDSTVRIWEISNSKPFVVLTQHKQPVQRVQFSPNEDLLFSSAEDGTCVVWNMNSIRNQVFERETINDNWIQRERERRRHAAVLANGSNTVPAPTLEQEEFQLLIDSPRNPLVFEPPLVFPHTDPTGNIVKIVCMAVHPTGKFVATGSEDCLGRVWSVDPVTVPNASTLPPPPNELIHGEYEDGSSHLLCTLSGHTVGFVHHIEWSHKGDRILTFSDKDGTARIWFWPYGEFQSKPQQIALKVISSSSSEKVSGSRSSTKLLPMIDGAGFSKDDTFVVTTQSIKTSVFKEEVPPFLDSRICIWDSKTGNLLRFMRGHRSPAHVVRLHPELNWIAATCGSDGLIIFWDIEKGEEISKLEAISPEGFPSILDAKWSINHNHPCDFICTDSMGRLLLLGTGGNSELDNDKQIPLFADAHCQQFFSNERDTIIFDQRTNEALDANLQIPLHLIKTVPLLVDVDDIPYMHQPPPILKGQGRFFDPPSSSSSNLNLRINEVLSIQKTLSLKENHIKNDDKFKNWITLQDQDIYNANEKDLLRNSFQTPSKASSLLKKIKQQKKPGTTIQPNDLTLSSSDDDDDDDEEDNEDQNNNKNGRSRRAAARKATAKIHKHARKYLEDGTPATNVNDQTYHSTSRYKDDDEDDELSNEEEDDDDDDDDDDNSSRFSDIKMNLNESGLVSRYSTRKLRRNYQELNDDKEDDFLLREKQQLEGEQNDDGKRKKKRNEEIISFPDGFSDQWLTCQTETSWFVPQVGDEVTYFPQGHAEYLRYFPSSESPPWHAWNVKEWPFVACSVLKVEYVFPEKDEPKQILCKCLLKVSHVKAPVGSRNPFVPIPSALPEIIFTVLYHSFELEFLILLEKFLVGIKRNFSVGSKIRWYEKNEYSPCEPKKYFANITEIAVKDNNEWPDSPWEAIACESADGIAWFVSPWEAELVSVEEELEEGEGFIPVWRIVSKKTQDELWNVSINGVCIQNYIASEINASPFWSIFYRTRRHPNLPCFLKLEMVINRLQNGHYYRQWESIEADFENIIFCGLFGKNDAHPLRKKAERFLKELKEILNYSKNKEEEEEDYDENNSMPCKVLKEILFDCLLKVSLPDKEGFFALPVDLTDYTDYIDVVEHPMDFATIRARIEESLNYKYITFSAARRFTRTVVRDVVQITLNASAYNGEDSIVFRRSNEVLNAIPKVFCEVDFETIMNEKKDEIVKPTTAISSSGRNIKKPSYKEINSDGEDEGDSILQDDDDDDDDDDSDDFDDFDSDVGNNNYKRRSTRRSRKKIDRKERYPLRSSQPTENRKRVQYSQESTRSNRARRIEDRQQQGIIVSHEQQQEVIPTRASRKNQQQEEAIRSSRKNKFQEEEEEEEVIPIRSSRKNKFQEEEEEVLPNKTSRNLQKPPQNIIPVQVKDKQKRQEEEQLLRSKRKFQQDSPIKARLSRGKKIQEEEEEEEEDSPIKARPSRGKKIQEEEEEDSPIIKARLSTGKKIQEEEEDSPIIKARLSRGKKIQEEEEDSPIKARPSRGKKIQEEDSPIKARVSRGQKIQEQEESFVSTRPSRSRKIQEEEEEIRTFQGSKSKKNDYEKEESKKPSRGKKVEEEEEMKRISRSGLDVSNIIIESRRRRSNNQEEEEEEEPNSSKRRRRL